MKVRWFGKTKSERCIYANKEEFARAFESERAALQRLALLLTANKEAAKRCLILALRECLASGSVSQGWVPSWIRRMVIRNAISLVMDRGCHSLPNANHEADNGSIEFSPDDWQGAIPESKAILDLPELDRFAFVICALERYSMHDCALLLGRSPRDIDEAQQRAANQVRQTYELGYSS